MKRPTTLPAGEFLVRQSLIRFEAHELVLRAAVRALERRCFGDRHGAGKVRTYTIYFTDGRSAMLAARLVGRSLTLRRAFGPQPMAAPSLRRL